MARTSITQLIPILLCAPLLAAGGSTASAPTSGTGSGAWSLPTGSATTGSVLGSVTLAGTTPQEFALSGTLTPTPFPLPIICLGCIVGEFVGTLDDGIGAGPDYYIRATYFGAWLSGDGTFQGLIREQPFPVRRPVGEIVGKFRDQPGDGIPGRFVCEVSIKK